MPNSAKRKVAAGAVGLALLAGSGGAYAAAQTTTPSPSPAPAKPKVDKGAEQKAFLDDVAKRLNVPRGQLDAAIKGAAEARIDAAVAAVRACPDGPAVPASAIVSAASRQRPPTSG